MANCWPSLSPPRITALRPRPPRPSPPRAPRSPARPPRQVAACTFGARTRRPACSGRARRTRRTYHVSDNIPAGWWRFLIARGHTSPRPIWRAVGGEVVTVGCRRSGCAGLGGSVGIPPRHGQRARVGCSAPGSAEELDRRRRKMRGTGPKIPRTSFQQLGTIGISLMQRGTRTEHVRAALEQHLLAVSLKDAGMDLDQIGASLGVSAGRAARVVLAGPRLRNAAAELQRRIPTRRKAIVPKVLQGADAP